MKGGIYNPPLEAQRFAPEARSPKNDDLHKEFWWRKIDRPEKLQATLTPQLQMGFDRAGASNHLEHGTGI
jgi:hypothetical protein